MDIGRTHAASEIELENAVAYHIRVYIIRTCNIWLPWSSRSSCSKQQQPQIQAQAIAHAGNTAPRSAVEAADE